MNDEEFNDLLRDAAATYNTPPAPPRDQMWDAIVTARAASVVVPIHSARRLPRWTASAVAAAALLMVGIAIGRQSRGAPRPKARVTANVQTSAAASGVPGPAAEAPSSSVLLQVIVADAGGEPASTPGAVSRAPATTAAIRQHSAVRRLAIAGTRSGRGAPNVAGNDSFNDADAYRLAVVEHLTRTEVLLTGFRAEARSDRPAKLDAQFAAVARELLGTTRYLLATRRGEDPVMTRLLQDLEYVLMQLSQYANEGRGADLDAINQSIDRRNVLPKLRYSIPAGVSASSGT